MLKDGKYSVSFRTPLAEGTGVVVLEPDGKLSGGDTIMLYTGIGKLTASSSKPPFSLPGTRLDRVRSGE